MEVVVIASPHSNLMTRFLLRNYHIIYELLASLFMVQIINGAKRGMCR